MITDVYTVSFADLKRLVGSKDRQALAAILDECGVMLRDADGYLDKGATVTCADALADLIEGADFRDHPPRHLYRYRCALEAIWAYVGEYLGQLEVEDPEEADKVLADLDIPLRYSDLVSGDEVVPLPAWDDVPCVGSWSAEQINGALPAFRRSGIEPLPWAEDGEYREPEEVIGVIRWFVEQAARRSGWGLVAFSY
jgi:hypothetical protein